MVYKKLISVAVAALLLYACSDGDAASKPVDAVASVGKHYLTRADVVAHTPTGLSEEDSTTFARAYIRNWVDQELVDHVAADEVDMDEINRLTDDYRRQLIMTRYRTAMSAKATDGIFAEDSLRAYYEAHQADFKLERPLVKGIYLKVPDDAPNLNLLRRLYKSDKAADIDRLEKEAPARAVHYDYFRDTWIDLEQIETRIPHTFDAKTLADIAAGRPLEVNAGGFTYLLSVTDYLGAGSAMPYEAAKPLVRERLLTRARLDYDRALRDDLYNRALADGLLQVAM